jgi:hypothetical protein
MKIVYKSFLTALIFLNSTQFQNKANASEFEKENLNFDIIEKITDDIEAINPDENFNQKIQQKTSNQSYSLVYENGIITKTSNDGKTIFTSIPSEKYSKLESNKRIIFETQNNITSRYFYIGDRVLRAIFVNGKHIKEENSELIKGKWILTQFEVKLSNFE